MAYIPAQHHNFLQRRLRGSDILLPYRFHYHPPASFPPFNRYIPKNKGFQPTAAADYFNPPAQSTAGALQDRQVITLLHCRPFHDPHDSSRPSSLVVDVVQSDTYMNTLRCALARLSASLPSTPIQSSPVEYACAKWRGCLCYRKGTNKRVCREAESGKDGWIK
ncbi:uncharacterized protein BKA78DRAFT_27161 [Phyllosticta capitalensis]|uniref:uncharacterized protein n=1 Tax=Phyllosticta capitalensis TaxID=121624 RepID=UPI00312F10F3